ncbi:MAG: hypothetical protein K1X72_05515 [Pyrinomonadaceae bacterium]|nr:hypothetical protein [Pyrinomonadaceae bacterium]
MKKIIWIIAILLFAFSLNVFGQSNKRKGGVTHEDTWTSKRKNKSTARTTKKPIGRPNGICTGCCDPCYNDDVAKIRNQRRKHPTKGVKAVRKRTKH